MTHYSVPYWPSRLPKSKRPAWPRLREPFACDVAVVGGGFAGCATAYVFAAAGIKTCLLEAAHVGVEGTGADSGLIRPHPPARFSDLERQYGRRETRRMFELSRHAALDLTALLRRLRIRCDLEACDLLAVARNTDEDTRLRREHRALGEAGIGATWVSAARLARETGIEARGAIRAAGAARIDPYRACLGLARAAAARGARIFEQSPVVRVRAGRKGIEVETRRFPVAARAVVIATGGAGPLFKPLQRHFELLHTYAALTPPIEGRLSRRLGRDDVAVTAGEGPSRLLTRTRDGRLLFCGADQRRLPERSRAKGVVQRTGQLMYELSLLYPDISGVQPDHGWDAPIAQTADGVVYAGLHRNYPHHLFALGVGHGGPGAAYLAARILLRRYAQAPAAGDDVFAFARA
jgi:glycine/D-amino acid oxidase-like deaminating enzyme